MLLENTLKIVMINEIHSERAFYRRGRCAGRIRLRWLIRPRSIEECGPKINLIPKLSQA